MNFHIDFVYLIPLIIMLSLSFLIGSHVALYEPKDRARKEKERLDMFLLSGKFGSIHFAFLVGAAIMYCVTWMFPAVSPVYFMYWIHGYMIFSYIWLFCLVLKGLKNVYKLLKGDTE